MTHKFDWQDEGDVAVQEAEPTLKRPSLYKVVVLNDDYTPMDFVIFVLEEFFSLDRHKATQVMLSVHTTGKGIAGLYSKDVAESKVSQVNDFARENEQPLLTVMEQA